MSHVHSHVFETKQSCIAIRFPIKRDINKEMLVYIIYIIPGISGKVKPNILLAIIFKKEYDIVNSSIGMSHH